MIEQRFIDMMAQNLVEEPEPIDEVQLAESKNMSYPNEVMSDTGGGAMVGYRLNMPKRLATNEDRAKQSTLIANTLAGQTRGMVQGFGGIGGDLETVGRMALNVLGFNVGSDAKLITSKDIADRLESLGVSQENISGLIDRAMPSQAGSATAEEKARAFGGGETLGEVTAPGGQIALGAKVAKPVIGATKKIIEAGKDLPVGMSIKPVGDIPTGAPRESVVSTRLPTAVKATENPLESNLIIDFDAVKKDPEAFKHNMGLIQQYPNFASKAKTPERRAEDFITEVKDNLLFLHDQVPDATRQRSKLWYDGARNIVDRWTGQYNVPDNAISGVLAVLSPQKDWFMNVSLGERVLDIMSTKRGIKWDSSMDDVAKVIWAKPQYAEMVNSIRGKSLDELQDDGLKAMWLRTYDQANNPREHQIVSPEGDFVGIRLTDKGQPYKTGWGSLSEIGKAIKIYENPTVENISNNLGAQHKVRNFYNNIYDPTNPAGYVTIDTHAVAAGLLRPLSGNSREVAHNFGSNVLGEVGPKNSSVTGVQGTYGLYAEAYRRAAQERNVLPREMQSITWEAVRGLFPDTFKNAKNNELVDSIWLKYRKGQISQEEARSEVLKSANGINAPEWERTGRSTGTAQEVQRTTNEGELPGSSVSRGTASGMGSGKRTRATKGTAPGVTTNNNLPAEEM
jgi:hypothetical protein